MKKHGALKFFVVNPDSKTITRELTNRRATVCEHKLNPCHLECGVRAHLRFIKHGERKYVGDKIFTDPDTYELIGAWEAIPNGERRKSMAQIVACAAKSGFCAELSVNDRKRLHGWGGQEP